jgi:endonuclease/exonuclease/phosphatase family metal-dependent hydrolase
MTAIVSRVAFGTIGVLFLIAAIRMFTSRLYQSFFGAIPNETLGAIAIAVFAASILAIVPAWRSGPRAAATLSATVLAGGMLAATAWRWDMAEIVLSAVAVVGGTWWLALAQSSRDASGTSPVVHGLPLAVVIDLALRAAFHTQPVPDLGTPIAVALVLAACLAFLASAIAWSAVEREWTSPGPRGALALVAIPALLLVSELGAADPEQAAGAGGLDRGPQAAGAWYLAAAALGLGLTTGAVLLARASPPARIAAVAAIAVGSAALWARLPVVSTVGAMVLAAGVFATASILPDTAARPARYPIVTTVALAIGWIAFVALAFVFYAYYAPIAAPLAAAAIVVLGLVAAVPLPRPRFAPVGIGVVALVGVVAPLLALVMSAAGPPPAPSLARTSFRLVTYNVHQGFDVGNVPSLDRIADVLAAEDPDVVVLEEVVRGWMIDDQHDLLTLVSQRLGMPYVFDPQIGDTYGNAVLSRLPMTDIRRIYYPREPQLAHQPRGAVLLEVGGVLLMATHLDHIDAATEVRQRQVRMLLDAWGGAKPVVLAGDLNARPGSPELRLLEDAGFRDLAKDDGADQPTIPSDRPTDRIDYVWGIGVVGSEAHTVATTASDHRPVVMNISVR